MGDDLGLEITQGPIELGRREAGRDGIEHEGSALTSVAQLGQLRPEQFPLVERWSGPSRHEDVAGIVEVDPPAGVDDTGAELDAGHVSLADAPQAHHEAGLPGRHTLLIGREDHRGVADRRGFDGVLGGEERAHEQPALG